MATATAHYGEEYFTWQRDIGAFGGWANRTKFEQYIGQSDNVLDFGCGGGYLLAGLNCRGKLGIEVNPAARGAAERLEVQTAASVAEAPDGWADVIISNHALEHCEHPLGELRALLPKLRPGGRCVIVVPCETIGRKYRPGDVNHHLYSWSPMALGNLLTDAGYAVELSAPYIHKWPPFWKHIATIGGRRTFDTACRIFARIDRRQSQVRAVARRPFI